MSALADLSCLPQTGDRFHGLTFAGAAPASRARSTDGLRLSSTAKPSAPVQIDDDSCPPEEKAFLEFVLARGRQSLQNYRAAPLLRRLPACLRALHVDSLDEARRLLEQRPDLASNVLDSLLIGATSFYRDAPVFDYLRERALPRLFGAADRVRILSAACSDGSELYTVAALVSQLGRLGDADLWGLDCRESAIEKARAGRYAESSLQSFPESLRGSYLTPANGQLQVSDDLIAATNWTIGNALSVSQLGNWNLILCRNLAIYLRPTSSTALWHSLFRALEPGGHLVVGRAEKPQVAGLSQVGPCTYRKADRRRSAAPRAAADFAWKDALVEPTERRRT